MERSLLLKLILVLTFILISCKSEEERELLKVAKNYIKDTNNDKRSVVFISDYESNSSMKVYRVSSLIFEEKPNLEVSSYKYWKGIYIFYSLQQQKKFPIPKKILRKLTYDPGLEYDPVEWLVLKCPQTNQYLTIKHSNYRSLSEIKEYVKFKDYCKN